VPTIYDVAKRARVSTYTVSAVLNRSAYVSPELTKRVLAAVKDLDYTVNELARSLQTRKTLTIGMLIPDIANPFYAKAVRGAEDQLRESGYSLILASAYNSREEQARILGVFRAKQVDGLLLFMAADSEDDARKLVDSGKPVVFVGREPRGFDADSVTADNVMVGTLGVGHLAERGHRRIAIISGHLGLSVSEGRVEGWRRVLKKHKLPAPAEYLREGDWTEDSGYRLMLELLDLENAPTGVFCANFLVVAGALRALKERGIRCPADVELVSADDSAWLDVFSPPITTVATPSYEIGQRGALLLVKRIQKAGRRYERIVLAPKLIARV
jgi:DNA-binding LacI/PurR family transcriptional regulator